MKKIQNMLVWLRKMVLAPHTCAEAGKRRSTVVHLQSRKEKSVTNMM
jgi:hypothetical protein